jgi:DNA-3-methyladenine glycosylase I
MPVPAIPERIVAPTLNDYLEVMTRAVFQAGVSWAMIANKWEYFRAAFYGFNVARVAAFDEGDIERLMADENILRSSKKIRATIQNAQAILELDRSYNGFANYLRSFADYSTFEKDFRKRFKFMGEMNVWYFRFRVGEDVPKFEDWLPTIQGDHPRMREMVELARTSGTFQD